MRLRGNSYGRLILPEGYDCRETTYWQDQADDAADAGATGDPGLPTLPGRWARFLRAEDDLSGEDTVWRVIDRALVSDALHKNGRVVVGHRAASQRPTGGAPE